MRNAAIRSWHSCCRATSCLLCFPRPAFKPRSPCTPAWLGHQRPLRWSRQPSMPPSTTEVVVTMVQLHPARQTEPQLSLLDVAGVSQQATHSLPQSRCWLLIYRCRDPQGFESLNSSLHYFPCVCPFYPFCFCSGRGKKGWQRQPCDTLCLP